MYTRPHNKHLLELFYHVTHVTGHVTHVTGHVTHETGHVTHVTVVHCKPILFFEGY